MLTFSDSRAAIMLRILLCIMSRSTLSETVLLALEE